MSRIKKVISIGGIEGGKVPQPPRPTQRPTGPKFLRLTKNPSWQSGPGNPPAGFVKGSTSKSEWIIYWALTKILGPEATGGWSYQQSVLGGREKRGGSVADFALYLTNPITLLRIQTERWHITQPSSRQQFDVDQRRALERAGYVVIDIFDEDFLTEDDFTTGQAAIKVVHEAIQGVQMPNPVTTQTSRARG